MKSLVVFGKLQCRNFAKVTKKAGSAKSDGVGLSTVSEFWFGDKISVWDRHTLLGTAEDSKVNSQLWLASTPAFDKILKDNFEKELANESRRSQPNIDNVLLFDQVPRYIFRG